MKLLEFALNKELEGALFYSSLADKLSQPAFKLMFEWLAGEERKHAAVIKKIQQDQSDIELMIDEEYHFSPKLQAVISGDYNSLNENEIDLLIEAYSEEKNSYQYYLKQSRDCTDPKAAEIFSKLAAEEKHHEYMIARLISHFKKELLNQESTVTDLQEE